MCALKFCYVSLDSHMLRTSGYVQNCTIGLQWHLMGTYHYSYYNPETSDGKFSQVECLYLLIQYLYIKSKMHTEFFLSSQYLFYQIVRFGIIYRFFLSVCSIAIARLVFKMYPRYAKQINRYLHYYLDRRMK